MIKDIRYKFDDFSIAENDNEFSLITNSNEYNYEQKVLFTMMLNFGYIGFEPGIFSVTAKDIVNFWQYTNQNVLKDYTLEHYYELLNLNQLYTDRIPYLKGEGAFHSNDFAISVRWMNVDSNMYSEPIAYEQKGLKLKELEYGDTLGSLFPEYFELYYLVDKANTNWSNWGNKEKYEFLEELDNHTKKRSFEISDNLMQLLNKHRNVGAK